MRREDTGLVVAVGAGALAAVVFGSGWWRRRSSGRPVRPPAPPAGGWVWPVTMAEGRAPVVSSGWGSPRRQADGSTRGHRGVDIMFRRSHRAELADRYPPGSPNGSAWHFMPNGVFALAARDGRIWSAGWTPRGYAVVLDHGKPWATFYQHLDRLLVAPARAGQSPERVVAGQPIGVIGASPEDAEHLSHLHFELWHDGEAINPERLMSGWPVVRPSDRLDGTTRVALVELAAVRNGGLAYRPVGSRGEPYPEWLRQLSGSSGVYVIRQDGEVVYVGSSSANRLYETLTRHFQGWRRSKGFWKGQFAEGHDPGVTYDRGSVDAAVRVTPPGRALDEEARLIRRLRPRDNLIGQPAAEEVPF